MGVLLPSSFDNGFLSLGGGANIIYCDLSPFQPMEIYVDDEAKLTLHGLVQVCEANCETFPVHESAIAFLLSHLIRLVGSTTSS